MFVDTQVLMLAKPPVIIILVILCVPVLQEDAIEFLTAKPTPISSDLVDFPVPRAGLMKIM